MNCNLFVLSIFHIGARNDPSPVVYILFHLTVVRAATPVQHTILLTARWNWFKWIGGE